MLLKKMILSDINTARNDTKSRLPSCESSLGV